MPQPTKNAPDLIDLTNLQQSLGEEYAHVVYFTLRVRADKVEVVAKSTPAPYTPDTPPTHVALQSWPVRVLKDWPTVLFTLAFDLWLQHDGGGATAAKRGPTYGWGGRVEIPGRRKHK